MIVREEEDSFKHSDILSRMVLPNEGEEVISRGRLVQQFPPCEFRGDGRMRRDRIPVLLAVVEDTLEVVLATFDRFDVGVIGRSVVGKVEEAGVTDINLSCEGKADVVVGVAILVTFTSDGVVLDGPGTVGE